MEDLRLLSESEAQKYTDILAGYRPNPSALEIFSRSNFVVIAGPTGAGKDTIRARLIKMNPQRYVPILSTTTRPPRMGEEDGVQYHFRSIDYMDAVLKDARLLQADVIYSQQISALDAQDLLVLKSGQVGLSILVVQTEQYLRKLHPALRTVFIVPPSLEVLLDRIQVGRNMAAEELRRRLQAAAKELEIALAEESYFCVINDDIDIACQEVESYISRSNYDLDDKKARLAISKILNELSNL